MHPRIPQTPQPIVAILCCVPQTASDEEPGEGEEPDEGDGGRHDTGTGLSCVIEEVE